MLFAFVALRTLLALAPASMPRLDAVTLDGRALAVTLAITVLEAVAFSLVPTTHGRRTDLAAVLRKESSNLSPGRERVRLRRALAATQVALAVTLLVCAGLLLRSFWHLQSVDPGFRTEGVIKAEFQLSDGRYPADDWPRLAAVHRFNETLQARASALPGVQSAAVARNHPFDAGSTNAFTIAGREAWSATLPEVSIRSVSPEYFDTLGVPLLAGRLMTDADRVGAPPVMVLNDAAARTLFPEGDGLGQRIAVWGAQREVIGVVSNERILGLVTTPPPAVYVPLAQVPPRDGHESLIVRAHTDPAGLAASLRALFRELDPDVAVFGLEPLTQTVARSIARQRFTAVLVGSFAVVGVGLALVGVHGVLRHAVVQRRREIGIRMALGADRGHIVRSLMAEGVGVAAVGLVFGLGLAAACVRLLSTMLHEVSPNDPATIGVVVILVGSTVCVACLGPARAAGRLDTVTILRER